MDDVELIHPDTGEPLTYREHAPVGLTLREALAAVDAAAVDERRAAEREYTVTAFDYPRAPVGSRDWTLYWSGWQAALSRRP